MENRFEKFTMLISCISRYIQKIKNEEMLRYGLKGKQVQCIFALYNSENGLSASQLCETCMEDKGAMSRTLKELVDANFVFIDESGDKKYRNPIKLTAKGFKIAGSIVKKIEEMLNIGGVGLDDKSREYMYSSLTQISENLAKICESYGGEND